MNNLEPIVYKYNMIALDKFHGVRPIGVGEVVHRTIGNAVLYVILVRLLEMLQDHYSYVLDK